MFTGTFFQTRSAFTIEHGDTGAPNVTSGWTETRQFHSGPASQSRISARDSSCPYRRPNRVSGSSSRQIEPDYIMELKRAMEESDAQMALRFAEAENIDQGLFEKKKTTAKRKRAPRATIAAPAPKSKKPRKTRATPQVTASEAPQQITAPPLQITAQQAPLQITAWEAPYQDPRQITVWEDPRQITAHQAPYQAPRQITAHQDPRQIAAPLRITAPIPTGKHVANVEEGKCTICLGKFKGPTYDSVYWNGAPGDFSIRLLCKHIYCSPCLRRWSNEHHTCPCCRDPMTFIE